MRDDMKKASIASLLALLLSAPLVTAAAVPPTLAFSARIADNGKPVTGNHTVKFAIWNCDGSDPSTCVDPTNVLWSETQTRPVSDGVLTAVLGADTTTPNPLPAFTGVPLWIEVTFDGTVFTPRMAVHSAPFAFRAAEADHATSADTVPWTGVTGRPTMGGTAGGGGPSAVLAAGDNFIWAGSYAAPAAGRCMFTVTAVVTGMVTAANTSYLWGSFQDNGVTGLFQNWAYFPAPMGGNTSAATSNVISTLAGHNYQFGCYVYGSPDTTGRTAYCKVAWLCI